MYQEKKVSPVLQQISYRTLIFEQTAEKKHPNKKYEKNIVFHIDLNSEAAAVYTNTGLEIRQRNARLCNSLLKSILFKSVTLPELLKTHLHIQMKCLYTLTRSLTDWVVIWP